MNNTIELFKSYILELNLKGGNFDIKGNNPNDIEAFYKFCITSYVKNAFLEKKEFDRIFKDSPNIHSIKFTDDQINLCFSQYQDYLRLFEYMEKKWSNIDILTLC